MKKENEPVNSRREILAGMGLAALGLVGLNSVWQKLSFDDNSSTRNSNISKYKPAGDATPFPNVTLYTHDGEAVKFYDDLIRDKVVAINMMYSQCSGICPKSTANLREVRNILGERAGRDVFMYSITLDPERDTPRLLKQYAERYGIKDGWKFLTGAPEDVELVRYRLGFYDREEDIDNIKENHTGMVRIGNAERNRWSMAPTLADPMQIMATINHLDPKAVHTGMHSFQATHA
ncbi:SCO family protein [Nitrosomonas sp.]|uniref:SCO family protein n=1 Tax=Nitrosomonas sp. TaxID=42353 RepID=UPI002600DC3C|nr:SCO family protein [Nitrosomonas sp.]